MFKFEAPEVKDAHGGLLAVANIIRGDSNAFIDGVSYTTHQGTVTRRFEQGVAKVFDQDSTIESVEFTLYKGVESPLFVDTATLTDAAALFGAGETVAVEKAIQELLLNPAAVDITPTPGTAVTNIRGAVGLLEQRAGVEFTGEPVIHGNRAAVSLMRDLKINDSWEIRTKQGTPVANGAGYGATGPAAADAGEAWLYITGQINIWISSVSTHEARDLKTNRNHTLAEAQYVATVDTPVYAILIGM